MLSGPLDDSRPMMGLDAPDAVEVLVARDLNISAVVLLRYQQPPLLQSRMALQSDHTAVLDRALQSRRALHLPFWDAVMTDLSACAVDPGPFFEAALYHQEQHGNEVVLTRQEVLDGKIRALVSENRDPMVLAVSSEVRLAGGTIGHLPLIDFHCPVGARGMSLACSISARLLGTGFVVLQGHSSFHLWGLTPLTPDALVAFLGRALLFAPLVDRAYVAHQLMERRCALRISPTGSKPVPQVVHVAMSTDVHSGD
jgi:hypothetical protein